MSLHLNSGNLSIEQIQAIEDFALYIFANKKLMREHNRERLRQLHSVTNPVARLKVQSMRNQKKSTTFLVASNRTMIQSQL